MNLFIVFLPPQDCELLESTLSISSNLKIHITVASLRDGLQLPLPPGIQALCNPSYTEARLTCVTNRILTKWQRGTFALVSWIASFGESQLPCGEVTQAALWRGTEVSSNNQHQLASDESEPADPTGPVKILIDFSLPISDCSLIRDPQIKPDCPATPALTFLIHRNHGK